MLALNQCFSLLHERLTFLKKLGRRIFCTCSAGFIDSNFILDQLARNLEPVVKLTYAGKRQKPAAPKGGDRHMFVQGDFGDRFLLDSLLVQLNPRAVLHFAAESYLDRSIHGS